jgi:surface protein
MGILLNGNKPSKIIYNGAESSLYFNGSKIWPEGDPYNPLNLPPNTVRVRTSDGNAPVKKSSTSYETATLVSGTSDVYDIYKSGTSFYCLLYQSNNIIEVLGANTTGITNMHYMFFDCSALTSVSLFDTSSVTDAGSMFGWSGIVSVPLFDTSSIIDMSNMFAYCSSLQTIPLFNTASATTISQMFSGCSNLASVPLFNTSNVTNMKETFNYCTKLVTIPLFDTSKVTNMDNTFRGCYKVESGALALYQQASTQTTPPSSHSGTFSNCGRNTTTGAAELAQIPTDWGGTMS